ncbi:hypothetical protein Pla100_17960 [Neorhodopirellula pilleata]|uniref:Uncharacterized protein n=1 Tax=Neorhodopirellula pilleata TaxID=2714738 RepID=A0A5C6ARD0_9BACT|nr:hypothetical protein Pla100_17960 [Neorhodopirellula pilleata]
MTAPCRMRHCGVTMVRVQQEASSGLHNPSDMFQKLPAIGAALDHPQCTEQADCPESDSVVDGVEFNEIGVNGLNTREFSCDNFA